MANPERLKMSEKPLDTDRSSYPKTAEQASRNFEEHLRLTCPNWTERQIITALDDHRVKNLGLPPLAEANLTQEIRDWISLQKGEFQTRDVFEELNIPKAKKAQVSKILTRLIPEGFIERTGRRTGSFRRVEKELQLMDFFNSEIDLVDLKLPLGIHNLVNIMPGNIVIIAGGINSGKTAFLLNIIADNMDRFKIHYFNSEMSSGELKKRLQLFKVVPFEDWKSFKAYERHDDFADVIFPGKDVINCIDFLELYEDFWIVGKRIDEIYRKLDGALAIIALQKNPNVDYGLGGRRSIEKARLAISLDHGIAKIIKAKNWKGKHNPNNKEIKYKLVSGCEFIYQDQWSPD